MATRYQNRNDARQSLRHLAYFGAAICVLMAGGVAAAETGSGSQLSRASAQASVTISHPAVIRAARIEGNGGWVGSESAIQVAPIGVSQRDCDGTSGGNCSLVVYDMP